MHGVGAQNNARSGRLFLRTQEQVVQLAQAQVLLEFREAELAQVLAPLHESAVFATARSGDLGGKRNPAS